MILRANISSNYTYEKTQRTNNSQSGGSRDESDVFVNLFHDVVDVCEDATWKSDPSWRTNLIAVRVHTAQDRLYEIYVSYLI